MCGQFAVIGIELANRLLSKGYELKEVKQGKYTMVFYFTDTEDLYREIELYLWENGLSKN
jgi:hypothetical protein